jgi:hypothetical protein
MMKSMLTFYNPLTFPDPNVVRKSGQSMLDPIGVPASKYRFLPGIIPQILNSNAVPEWHPRLILNGSPESDAYSAISHYDTVPNSEGLLIVGNNVRSAHTPRILTFHGDIAPESAQMFAGEVGQVQEYRHDLAETIRSLDADLQASSAWSWSLGGNFAIVTGVENPAASNGIDPSSTEQNVCSPSLHLPSGCSNYFDSVLDELYTVYCEKRISLRKEITWLDRLLGYVDHVILVIRDFASTPVRLFCSVCWEHRTWFLYHGARPPRANIRAIMSLFVEACSGPVFAS